MVIETGRGCDVALQSPPSAQVQDVHAPIFPVRNLKCQGGGINC